MYYIFKGKILGHWISTFYRIPYGIIIPDANKKNSGEKLGEIIQGYCKSNLLIRIFAPKLFRPKFYKYFDSWEHKDLETLPNCYQPYRSEKKVQHFDRVKKKIYQIRDDIKAEKESRTF